METVEIRFGIPAIRRARHPLTTSVSEAKRKGAAFRQPLDAVYECVRLCLSAPAHHAEAEQREKRHADKGDGRRFGNIVR